ncbi:hypothetical protein LDENG_00082060 [Lucifuga dentata]|nr:hypothetical protein LDENG_00082060 [Lucifuga dentata]
MTSAEKRRSGRKSGGHRKHSDGSYSDASSSGSFLDETDREVSSLTDRAFRSLCIGDEAVYNDSDLCPSSPSAQADRQQAFIQSGQHKEDRDMEKLKRAAHENFSLRVQQYGQDWIHGGMYGSELQGDPRWGVYGDRGTQGRISATFHHSVVEMSQQEKSLREEQLSFVSNGATESQPCRSHSRVSSLIRAFNSEGCRDGAGTDGKLREWNDETSWDKSALMSIQRELSEFSTTYQQNFHSSRFHSAGPFCPDSSSTHINCTSSFLRSPHSKQGAATQVNYNSNFFIHSEFSPFKVWRDHNRFPFQQAEVSGFVHYSEFPKWYETPMYKELSLEAQPQGPSMYEGRWVTPQRNIFEPMAPAAPPRYTSTSKMLQKASEVEKRSESELAGHYHHHWKQRKSLGTNRLSSQRPSTVSPTLEMSRRVQDTLGSISALQENLTMMASEQNIPAELTVHQEAVLHNNNNLIPFGNTAATAAHNVVSSNTSTTPFNLSQLLTPATNTHQEAQTSEAQQDSVSHQLVEHPPVRAESRGATPDFRMSSYRSKATSLLFNLKDNRKRVKSTYSPPRFKGLETLERNNPPSDQDVHQHRDTVIDIPDFPDPDIHKPQEEEETSRTDSESHQHSKQFHRSVLVPAALTFQPTAQTDPNSEYTSTDYPAAQMNSEMFHHSGFTGLSPESYTHNQLANGQNLHEDLLQFTHYKQSVTDKINTLTDDVSRHAHTNNPSTSNVSFKPSPGLPTLNADNSNQKREHLITKTTDEQHCYDSYSQLKENKHNYSTLSSQDKSRQQVCINSSDTEKLGLKAPIFPWMQELPAETGKDLHEPFYQGAATIKEEFNPPEHNYKGENWNNIIKPAENTEVRESLAEGKVGFDRTDVSNGQYAPLSEDSAVKEKPVNGKQQPGTLKDKHILQNYCRQNEKNDLKENYLTQNHLRSADQEYRKQHIFYSNGDKSRLNAQEPAQYKHCASKENDALILQQKDIKQQFESNTQRKLLHSPDKQLALLNDGTYSVDKAEQAMTEQIKSHQAQAEPPKAESAPPKSMMARHKGTEKIKAELTEEDKVKHAKRQSESSEEATATHVTEQARGTQPEQTKHTSTKTLATRQQHASAKAAAEQEEQLTSKQNEAKRLKEEHKTELSKAEEAEQARTEPAKTKRNSRDGAEAERQAEWIRAEKEEMKWVKAEECRTERINAEQTGSEQIKSEPAKLEQVSKVQQEKTKCMSKGNIKSDHITMEAREKKAGAAYINGDQSRTETAKAEETKPEPTLEQLKLSKGERMQQRLAKSTAILAVTSEPDKVEQVKTELAKAKAELAKIKEKMRGEQKEKARHTDVPVKVNISKNTDVDQATQMQQQKEDSVSRQSRVQADNRPDDYERLREKYGFTHALSTSRSKMSTAGNVSLKDDSEAFCDPNKAEPRNNKASKAEESPGSVAKTGSSESNEVKETQYVYSESSKEFKLSSVPSLHAHPSKRLNSDAVKDDRVMNTNFEKCDPLKNNTDVSLQRDSDFAKPVSLEKKPKSNEQSVVPGKEAAFTPLKALSHKDRSQTKQEILTSKIKAHAEKEIFAIRDAIISKNSNKQLVCIQSTNVRQKPPSQDASRIPESIMASNITPKQQSSGIEVEQIKSVSPPKSSALSAKSSVTTYRTDQLLDRSQKEALKTSDTVTEAEAGCAAGIDERLTESLKKEERARNKLPAQNKEQAPNIKEKQEANHGEITGKQTEGLKGKAGIVADQPDKKKEDPSLTTARVTTQSSKLDSADGAKSTHQPIHTDSSEHGTGQREAADDSLQIKGIMITVRERNPPGSKGQRDKDTQDQNNAKEKEQRYMEPVTCHPCSRLQQSNENESSKEVSVVKTNDRVIKETGTTAKHDESKADVNNHYENMQETSKLEAEKYNVISEKKTIPQQESSSINESPQVETGLQDKPPDLTVPAKNKTPAETQPLLNKQIITSNTKAYKNKTPKEDTPKSDINHQVDINAKPLKTLKLNIHDKPVAKSVNTQINCQDNSKDVQSLKQKRDVQLSVRGDTTTVMNPSNSSNRAGAGVPLLEEKRNNLTSADTKPNSKGMSENESMPNQETKTHSGQNTQVGDNVHIDSIAIQAVPAVNERDRQDMTGKHHIITTPSTGVAAVNENQPITSSSHEGKMKSLNIEDLSSHFPPARREPKQTKDENIEAQLMLSDVRQEAHSELNRDQHSNITAARESTPAKNGHSEKAKKPEETVDEVKRQPMEENYFQLQGETDTHTGQYTNSRKAGDSQTDSQGKEVSKQDIREVTVLDESIKRKMESSSANDRNENMKKTNQETEEKIISKQNDNPTERLTSRKEKKTEAPAVQIRKDQSGLSVTDRQNSRNSHPTRENTVKEHFDEVKPKPKERFSTVPEISALADYARLKVIVSEDQPNKIHEFPPSKKEGFFPIIQTRHSRRPVFTAETQEVSVKEKSLPNKSEVSTKVNKDVKHLVFPIMEKEHQRTGMFKLGEKERQEEVHPHLKAAECVSDAGPEHTQDAKERNKAPPAHLQAGEAQNSVARTHTGRHPNIHQQNRQAPASSSSDSRPKNASLLQNPPDNRIQDIKPKESSLKDEGIPYFDRNSHPQPMMGLKDNVEESTATLRKDEKKEKEDKGLKTEDKRTEKLRQERFDSQHKEIKAAVKKAEWRDEEERRAAAATDLERRAKRTAEDMQVKEMMAASRASLAEEDRRIAQREEERRAREREAIAVQIKERREKPRQMERRAEEERNAKQVEAQKEEKKRARQREHERRIKETEEEKATKVKGQQIKENEEERSRKIREEVKRVEEQRRKIQAKQVEEEWKAKQKAAQTAEEKRIHLIQEKRRSLQPEEQRTERQREEGQMTAQTEEDMGAVEKEKRGIKQREEQQNMSRLPEKECQASKRGERDNRILAKREEEESSVKRREEEMSAQGEEDRKQQRRMDALQYYAITSVESDRKPRHGLLPSQQTHNPSELDSTEESRTHSRPHAPPAPPPPCSNTSSPALEAKPAMFRVKDNTMRGPSFIKSVRPRFHKNFGEDFRVGSPLDCWRGSERGEDEQDRMSRSAGTPVHPDVATMSNRLKESFTPQPASSAQDSSAPLPQYRPFSRRSMAVDEEDSRSVISNMSEDVKSFATSAADLTDIKSLYDYERSESACSFSSDVARSLGKPPAVPPKTEKALRRAQRLTTRRIKKELSNVAADLPTDNDKPLHSIPSSPSERHPALASPHFSPPVSLTHTKSLGTTLHHSSHPAPVTQYHVESAYGQSFPLTQRKVLQDLGSGQYFVVNMPVPVKTKTFFDPETGKYVQLNVRESTKSGSQSQPAYSQLQPQVPVKQQPRPQESTTGKPFMLHQDYHGYPQSYNPMPTSSIPPHRSAGMSVPASLSQDQDPVRESHRRQANELRQNSDRHEYSPEQPPYMDTAYNTDKTCNLHTVYNTPGSYQSLPEYDTNSQLAENSVYEHESSAHSRYQPRNIITMSELEDFMDVSDW